MDERTYWTALEFRLCAEFNGLPERRLQYWWCDGLEPGQYLLDSSPPQITGGAWICNGPKQDIWRFILFLDKSYGSREEIDWSSILPPQGVTSWIAIDESNKVLQMEPSAAVPDFPVHKRSARDQAHKQ
jgi:hypothetical protein